MNCCVSTLSLILYLIFLPSCRWTIIRGVSDQLYAKCWSSSLLVHLKDLIPKRNRSTCSQKKVLLETHYSTFQLIQLILNVDILYMLRRQIMRLVLLSLLRVDISFFEMVDISFWNQWHFTLTEHRPVQYPSCFCLFIWHPLLSKSFCL